MESLAAAPRFDRRVVLPECRMSPVSAFPSMFRLDASPRDKSDATPVVIIVDGDVSVRASLELLFASAGWQAEGFACATEFLARPRTAGSACLVVDVSLPDINGL